MQVRRFSRQDGGFTVADAGGDNADPCVVLVHGSGECRHVMAHLARGLVTAGRSVISVDLRGHGDSSDALDGEYGLSALTDDLRQVISELGVPVALVGQRLGGLVSILLAAELGAEMVPALVVLDADPGTGDDRLSASRARLTRMHHDFADLIEAQEQLGQLRRSLGSEAMLRRVMRQRDDGRWQWRMDPRFMEGPAEHRVDLSRDRTRLVDAFGALSAPTLFLRTEPTSLLDPDARDALLARNPRAEIRDLIGAAGESGSRDRILAEVIGQLETHMRRDPGRSLRAGVDPMTLRQVFGCFATGVTILTTTTKDGTPVGLTANSFCSVSLDPPLLLFCIDRKASTLDVFEEADSFAVNILHIGQQELSNQFVKKGIDRFEGTGWEQWDTQAPIVQDSMASLECEKYQVLDGGDHRIFIGRVREVLFDPARDPLLFFQGKYQRVHVPQ